MRLAMLGASGGSGRTTLTLELGIFLARRGHKTLMVDLDPQGGLASRLGREDDDWKGLADLLMGRVTLGSAVKGSSMSGLALLPRGRLDPRDACEFQRSLRKPRVLEAALRGLEKKFDVLLLDLPAGVGMIPRGALSLSTHALVTFRAEPQSARTVVRTLRLVDHVSDTENTDLTLIGAMASFEKSWLPASQEVIADLRSRGVPVLDARIPDSDLFVRASEKGQPAVRLAGKRSRELRPIQELSDMISGVLAVGADEDALVRTRSPFDGRKYGQFTAERFRERLSLSVHEDPEGGGPMLDLDQLEVAGSFGSVNWQRYLEACLKATSGETAVVVDDQGLPLASSGKIPNAQLESLGTRLAIAFDQSSRMEVAGGVAQAVLVEFDHLWLTGLAIGGDGKKRFTLGILGPEPITPTMRREIRGTLAHLLDDVLEASPGSGGRELSFDGS